MVQQREINIGKSKIKFKNRTKKFSLKDDLFQLIIQAYKIKGEKIFQKILRKNSLNILKKLKIKVLVSQLKFAICLDSEKNKKTYTHHKMWHSKLTKEQRIETLNQLALSTGYAPFAIEKIGGFVYFEGCLSIKI